VSRAIIPSAAFTVVLRNFLVFRASSYTQGGKEQAVVPPVCRYKSNPSGMESERNLISGVEE
jgi:hypothetical protein